jgi:subtilisin family serine protease
VDPVDEVSQPELNSTAYFDFTGACSPACLPACLHACLPACLSSTGGILAQRPNTAYESRRVLQQQVLRPTLKRLLYCLSADLHGHGSHTAGTVGAVGNSSVGVTGVAWNVGLLICKAAADGYFYSAALLDCYSLCEQVQCSMRAPASAAVVAAFEQFAGMLPWPGLAMPTHTSPPQQHPVPAWLQAGVRVVSASYGGYYFDSLEKEAIASLGRAGALFVAAAGNGEHPHWGNGAAATRRQCCH